MRMRTFLLVTVAAFGSIAAAAQAADETLILAPVFPAAQTARQSYIRLVNPTANTGKVTISVKNEAGTVLGTFVRSVAANAAPQIGMSEIEAGLTTKPTIADRLKLEVTANFYGSAQHVIYNPAGGALTNLSNCGSRILVDARTLTNVHTSLLLNSFPSSVVIANRGTTAGAATLNIFDSATGAKLGTYTSASIPASGYVTVTEQAIEQAIKFTPNASQYHITVQLSGAFVGALSHLVDNFGAGAITDMTQRCAMFGPPPSSFATADMTSKLSFIGTWTPITKTGNLSVVEYYGRVPLGSAQRTGIVGDGWVANFVGGTGGFANATASDFTQVSAVALEQDDAGLLSLATSKYLPSTVTNGAGSILTADFNGDGIADIFIPVHNESPNLPYSSTAYISKSDGTFTKLDVGDSVAAHGSALKFINGQPVILTANYAGTPKSTQYTYNSAAGNFSVKGVTGSISPGGVTFGDFLGDGFTQVLYSDAGTAAGLYSGTSTTDRFLNLLYKLINNDLSAFRICCTDSTQVNGIFTSVAGVFKLPVGYFNGKSPQYDSYVSYNDPYSKTHNAEVVSFDINNDGKLDALVQAEIFPGKPYPGSEFTGNWSLNKLQLLINQGQGVFTDVTDTLNPDWSETAGSDVNPAYIPDENGGLLAVITNGWGVLTTARTYVPGTSGNRIFLNDGTGRLHLVMQDENMPVADQVYRLMGSQLTGCWGVNQRVPHRVRLIPFQTPSGNFNFMGSFYYKTDSTCVNGPNSALQQFALANVPYDLNLTVDFRKNITITKRNGSKRIRTFGGDDVIYKTAGDPDARIDGGVGRDKVVYPNARATYTITKQADGSYAVKDNAAGGTTDTLVNIETAQFSDASVDLY